MSAPRTHRRKLTAARVRELLDCDPIAGTLTWLPRSGNPGFNAKCGGRHAGTSDRTTGYRRVMIDGRYYYEHVIVWVHTRGYWPPRQLDHKSGNRVENRLDNLRPATPSQQTQNQKRHADAKNPVKCCRQDPSGRWRATIVHQGRSIWLGSYATLAEAAAARWKAEEDLFDPAFRRVEPPFWETDPDWRAAARAPSRPAVPTVRSDRARVTPAERNGGPSLPQLLTSGLQCYLWALQHHAPQKPANRASRQ